MVSPLSVPLDRSLVQILTELSVAKLYLTTASTQAQRISRKLSSSLAAADDFYQTCRGGFSTIGHD